MKPILLISTNPADNSVVWRGECASEEQIAAAEAAAHAAFPEWAVMGYKARSTFLTRFADIVQKKRQELQKLIAIETGKPLWEADTEAASVIGKAALSIRAYEERNKEIQFETAGALASLSYKPQGVVAVFGAYNFPAHLSNGQIMPALLAGNTVIYKPSELAPAVGEWMTRCWNETGLPSGVFQCLQGDADTGRRLLDTRLQGVFFTGSYATGKQIHRHFGGRPEVILALEMGGNNPLVISSHDDLQALVYHTLLSSFITAGQRCTCARRLIVPKGSAGDAFLSALIQSAGMIRVGPYTETPEPFIGPVISETHARKQLDKQDELAKSGGKILLPMTLLKENRAFLTPGIMDMSGVAKPPDEEIFAPFLQVYRYHDFGEAVRLANQTRYGLAAGLLGGTSGQFEYFYNCVNAGVINWNRPTTGAVGSLPFGGTGFSGNHRPGAFFTTDSCAYPVAGLSQKTLQLPLTLLPGLTLKG